MPSVNRVRKSRMTFENICFVITVLVWRRRKMRGGVWNVLTYLLHGGISEEKRVEDDEEEERG